MRLSLMTFHKNECAVHHLQELLEWNATLAAYHVILKSIMQMLATSLMSHRLCHINGILAFGLVASK